MIDALGDVGGALKRAQPDSLVKLYRDLGIEVSYRRREDGGVATIALRVVNGLFDLRRAPSGSSLTIGGSAECSATVLGADSCLGYGSRRRRVSPV